MKESLNTGQETTNVEKRIGNLYGYTGGNFHGNVYDKEYISPTILTFQGGQKQPMVIVEEDCNI